jgi:ubiquinone/menaquinone biosynthesis C-methylase UbiE
MIRPQEAVVSDQFGPQAKAYVDSVVHAQGADLDRISALATEARPRKALDLGTGGGHVAYRLAAAAEEVVACDLSPAMLAAVTQAAAERELHNVRTELAAAERLPFKAEEFDFLACRFTAHHWRDFEKGIREGRRVLQSGAPAIYVDAIAPSVPLFDSHLQAIELLRDTSHVRDYTAAEWMAVLGRNGFAVEHMQTWRLRMDFQTWTARMRTPNTHAQVIRALQDSAATDLRVYFGIEDDGSFLLDVLALETRAI